MRKTPKIRFAGFTDAWEQCKLIDISDIITGTTPPTKDKDNYDGDRLFVSPADIQGNRYVENTITTLTEKGYALGRELRPGTSLFVSIGSTIGKVAQIKDFGTTNQQINAVIPNDDMDDNFTFTMLENEADKIKKLYAQQAVPIINKTTFGDVEIKCPKKDEQTKIGEFFSSIDHLITLHQRKCENLKKVKKFMLQKMFPKNGASKPEIRFEGFMDAWEQRKFEEFVRNVAKKNKDNLDLEPYAVTNDRGFIAQKDAHDEFGYMSNVDRTAYNIVPPNSFAYNPARINVGSLGYYSGSENVIVSSLYEVFQTEEYIDDRFLWHWLKSEYFPKWIEKLQEGSVRLYFYFDKLVQCQLMLPSYEEQQQISAYFDSIDHLITLHQRKCETLKKMKKFMLQNMFV